MAGHECDAPVGVTVDGFGIPVIDQGVTVYERKDGPTSLSRRAEVTFPIEDGQYTYTDHIDAYQEDGNIQPATIRMTPLDVDSEPHDDYIPNEPVLRGYVAAVGSRSAVNSGRLRIIGPFNLLSQIPAGKTFGRDAQIYDVLQFVVDRFNNGQEIFDGVILRSTFEGDEFVSELTGSIPSIFTKSFTANRDTLADVVRYLNEDADIQLWFEPAATGDRIELHARETQGSSYSALTADDDITAIYNNALYEMRPFNAIRLTGKASNQIELGSSQIGIPSAGVAPGGDYPEAVAYYPPLVERAGGRIYQQTNSDKIREGNIGIEAGSLLKEELDEISGGTMDTTLSPQISPYDTIEARPACATNTNIETPVLEYEIERTAHTLAPDPSDENTQVPSSELAVSMKIDPELIKVETTTKSAQPSESGENAPPREDPASMYQWI